MTTSDSILTGEHISVLCASAVWEERRTSRSSASSGITSMATCIERSLSKGAPPRWNGEEDIAATIDATTMVATDAAATSSTIIDVTIVEEDDGPTPPRRPSAMDRRGATAATGNNAAAMACATRSGGSDSRIH